MKKQKRFNNFARHFSIMAIEGDEFRVDVDQVLKDKLGKKSKFVPKFLVSWLKNIIHQDWMNVHLCGEGKGQVGVEWLDGCLNYLNCTLKVQTNIKGVIQEGLDALKRELNQLEAVERPQSDGVSCQRHFDEFQRIGSTLCAYQQDGTQ